MELTIGSRSGAGVMIARDAAVVNRDVAVKAIAAVDVSDVAQGVAVIPQPHQGEDELTRQHRDADDGGNDKEYV